jgi:purine-nucleoside phosphorylase
MTDVATRMAAIGSAAEALRELCGGVTPEALVVLGSGLGPAAESLTGPRLAFGQLPGYVAPGVAGHAGEFVATWIGGKPVLLARGRIHLYEGHPADLVVLPVRAAAALGVPVMIATNAVGGVDPSLRLGDVVLVTDHINLTGHSPLTGANLDEIGPRFPNMSEAYRPELLAVARRAAEAAGVDLREGVLAAVPGPSYETPAEVRALRAAGADVVGMSTVPEVIAAVHAGMAAAVLSLVTNAAGASSATHEEVVEAAAAGALSVGALVEGILSRL